MNDTLSSSAPDSPPSVQTPEDSPLSIGQNLSNRIAALQNLSEFSPQTIGDFKSFLEKAPDEDLFRMSPLRYASAHGLPEQIAIDLFLHATHKGILEFAWGILCVGCMGFLTTPGGLRWFQKRHCNFCDIDTEQVLNDRVEVAFTVAPSVRRIRFHAPDQLDLHKDAIRLFFSSSIAHDSNAHRVLERCILMAERLAPEQTKELEIPLGKGATVLLAPLSHATSYLFTKETNEAPSSAIPTIEFFDGYAIPENLHLSPGPTRIRVINRTSKPIGFIVSPILMNVWPAPAKPNEPLTHKLNPYLTGSRLVSSQAFRDLFRTESIPSEGGLELKGVTILFTDLKGSTALYERVGDLRAYDLVRKHFSVLRQIAAACGGAIVKTIGDAIMASFDDPRAALQAAVRMHREIEQLSPEPGELMLKIGLHTGPCIAVDFNDRLDYFGRTVNIAARVQGVADAGETVCTEPVYQTAGVNELISSEHLSTKTALVSLKGIAEDVPIIRLTQYA